MSTGPQNHFNLQKDNAETTILHSILNIVNIKLLLMIKSTINN